MTQAAPGPLSEVEKIGFLGRATQRMAEHTFPYIASVLRAEDDDTGTFCGSAWRLVSMGKRAIVTAAHVLDEAASSSGIVAVSAERGAPPYPAPCDEWKRSPTDDLAVWFVPDAYAQGAPSEHVSFWSGDAIDATGSRIGTDLLFVHGFPQVRSHFSPALKGALNTSFPYGAMEREEPMERVHMGPHEFALHFEVEGLLASAGSGADFTMPHGLSGSAVWRLDVGGRRSSAWAPTDAKLVGMALRWVQDEQALTVLHARRVLALLGVSGASSRG